jgi:membrane associated rhomboid family serine protease
MPAPLALHLLAPGGKFPYSLAERAGFFSLMALLSSFNEDRPVSYFRGYPIYCATLLTIAYSLGVIATAFLRELRMLDTLIFSPARSIMGGEVWQIFTYSFVNFPNFFTIFSLFFLYIAAVEVEKYLGRSRFLLLYALLVLTPVLGFTAWFLLFRESYAFAGDYCISIGFVIAFCTLYPGLQWFGVLSLRWVGVISFVLAALVYVSEGDWPGLLVLTLAAGGSFGYVRFLQSGGELPRIPNPFKLRPRRRPRVVPSSGPSRRAEPRPNGEGPELDVLLDKIARNGLGSLTAKERAALERAREKLLENDRK